MYLYMIRALYEIFSLIFNFFVRLYVLYEFFKRNTLADVCI